MEEKIRQRVALGTYFFIIGFCFSTWASRIPTLKVYFDLNEAELGSLLLAMPISSMLGLPISGWLISRYNSRSPLLVAFFLFAVALSCIGFADNIVGLVISISLFSFCMRIINISINTQAVTLQKSFDKKIIGSFHGLWSSGGLAGVGLSTLMIGLEIPIYYHLLSVAIFVLAIALFMYRSLLNNDRAKEGNKLVLGKPDKFIGALGLMVFFAALCEGGMFDWSGVYFKEVVGEDVFTWGYLLFMIFMALSRFFSDAVIDYIGMRRLYIYSPCITAFGIILMVFLPYFWPALIGCCLVGIGVAAIIPMTFSLAGTSKKYSPGMAISIIATYGIIGMLLGPPLVGYLAQLINLRWSFLLFFLASLMLIPISRIFFKRNAEPEAVRK
ncbi:MFS transporter [Flavimarina sp. Hel_I_48]|uniref:MFS transporter n=1 Tax=Flavimarina sp. Hel_I_48 TaxID=1392488 RepID=UPI0004DFC1D5|nr:MFS transporter [Flavimarina sp. Hel_I_48]